MGRAVMGSIEAYLRSFCVQKGLHKQLGISSSEDNHATGAREEHAGDANGRMASGSALPNA